jgi:hypothetical protein
MNVCLWSPTGKARGTSIEIPSYAKASEGYPPVAKSTKASSFEHMNNLTTSYAFIHGQSPCLHAEVPVFAEGSHAGNRFGTQAWSSA